MPSIPIEEIERRFKALQTAMAAHGFDVTLIVLQVDLYYFTGTGQDAHLVIPVEGAPILLVRKDFQRASEETPLESVARIRSLSDLKDAVLDAAMGPVRKLGMELDVLPVNNFRLYSGLFPDAEIEDISPLVKAVRMVKSSYELAIINQAARMNDTLFSTVKDILREGLSEVEFSGLLEAEYRKMGHQGLVRVRSFNQDVFYGHVMSGVNLTVPSCSVGPTGGPGLNSSFPQGAGTRIIGRHEPVQIDYVGVVKGYLIDQARTFYLGEPPEEFVRAHDVALRIQQTIAEQGGAGAHAEDLYNTSLRIAREEGLEEGYLGYPTPVPFVGHGIGLELDESPVIGRKSPHVLEEGMVVALEPKSYFREKAWQESRIPLW